ncbi:hypothetical protein CO058_00540 [candidate division WWE3 bacterium CG_4_9_14_0_2_um_filter_35_11]|uniref:Recombinase family protein n=1 Tax=candidate division WWE3 bacterium CG_4_9_14_0_2_um_filter_35_11 TaxID=1975077 RepID=A0A2M8EMJ3_UNCKA|nr:MAG: hypothetical protein COV25_01355 [candidate division WWE3 bacterium CG10_big_fil_rev_8_21_14_0_10_35_32]PJC23964.1 MAG: hypothetical protein CO058_00540 [candidate division WWE3 bacterium CG_4_9_14_0_2_um_filter_35_11]
MKTVIFCRVSSKEQEIEGYSLPAQKKLLQEYTDSKDYKVQKIFSISESASTSKQRKTFKEMVAYLNKNKIKVLVVEKTDRLTRNLKDAVIINDWTEADPERKIHFVKENFVLHKNSKSNEKFLWNVKVTMAQYYIDNLSEEVKKGQEEKIAQGWLPTKPPVGYKTIGEKGKKTHVINNGMAPVVKKMFELYAKGDYSIKRLAERMYQDGLRSDKGKKIVKSRIHRLLQDPFYIGKLRWNGKVHTGSHEPLIDDDTFDKVHKLLKSKTTPKYNKHNYRYKGLLKCVECGGGVTWEKQKGLIYGHCNGYRDCSKKKYVKQNEIDEQIICRLDELKIKNERLLAWVGKAIREQNRNEINYYEAISTDLVSKKNMYERRISMLYNDKLDGKVTESFYNQKIDEFRGESEKIENTINKNQGAFNKYGKLGTNLYDLSQRASYIYKEAKSESHRRSLVNLMFSELILDAMSLQAKYNEAFDLIHNIVSVTNSSKVEKNSININNIFEPVESVVNTGISNNLDALRPIWPRTVYNVRTIFEEQDEHIYIPDLKLIEVEI